MFDQTKPGTDYRPDIDGLRAVAVVSVVLFHAFPRQFSGGFIGVDVFFVISGFLITSLIARHVQTDDFSFLDFYARRIRRIFPALLLVLFACEVFGHFTLYAGETQQLGKHILGGTTFVSNFMLWGENGYFDNTAASKPLLHLWSLGIEEQFYILWPLLIWCALKLRINLVAIIAAIAAASFTLNVTKVLPDSVAAFYSPQTRFWELLIGALLATNFPAQASALFRSTISAAGVGAILAALILLNSTRLFPGWWALLPTFGAAMIIAAGPDGSMNRILSHRLPVWIGLISFPLYLWHWPLLSFAYILRGREPTALMSGGLILLAVLLSWATYRLVERPIRNGGRQAFKVGSLACAAAVMGILGFTQFDPSTFGMTDQANAVDAQFIGPSTPWKYDVNETCKSRFPMADASNYGWWFCMLERPADPTVILLGDSRTNDFFPGISQNAAFARENILSIGACGGAWVDKVDPTPDITISPCSGNRPYEQMLFVNGIIDQTKSIRLAIIGSLPASFDAAYTEKLRKRVAFLEDRGIRVIVFSAQVPLGYDIKKCFRQRFGGGETTPCTVSADPHQAILSEFATLKMNISKTNPNTLFYDAGAFYCSSRLCEFKIDGMPLYRDQYGHLSEYASLALFRHFAGWMKTNAPILMDPTAQASR